MLAPHEGQALFLAGGAPLSSTHYREHTRWVWVYLLLEFQSKPDKWMAVRMMAYVSLLAQSLIKQKQLQQGQLPALIPLVLYNGQAPWTAPTDVNQCFAPILSVTLVPVLMMLFIRGRIMPEARNPVNRLLIWLYRPIIAGVMRWKKATVAVALIILAASLYPASRLGSEFMPTLNEGTLLYMPATTSTSGALATSAMGVRSLTES